MNQFVINGDNIELLKNYPDNYFDAVVTDPPYGLGKEPNAEDVMKGWIEKGYQEVSGSGFMGKEWDAFIPQPIFWKEVFRVLKHGGHVVSFFGTRTYDWGVMSMRFAGFEVRDCIQWLYGSGFPKSHNISKAIDKFKGTFVQGQESKNSRIGVKGDKNGYGYSKRITLPNPQSDEAKELEGWGSALKPANEPIVLARKPLEKGLSIAENVLKWGTGGINIDGCRVGTNEIISNHGRKETENGWDVRMSGNQKSFQTEGQKLGRFPANLILSCNCENEDSHNEDCPIKIMDEQSGISKTGDIKPYENKVDAEYSQFHSKYREVNFKGDKGGASRFFYCAKASKSERNKGLEGFEEKPLAFSNQAKAELKRGNLEFNQDAKSGEGIVSHGNKINMIKNFHPTVKPVKLMQYLVRLITPPNGKVLDPFCGSGTTGIACKLEGFEFVGLEQDAEYFQIAQSRIDNYEEEIEEIVYVTNKEGEKVQITQTLLF